MRPERWTCSNPQGKDGYSAMVNTKPPPPAEVEPLAGWQNGSVLYDPFPQAVPVNKSVLSGNLSRLNKREQTYSTAERIFNFSLRTH